MRHTLCIPAGFFVTACRLAGSAAITWLLLLAVPASAQFGCTTDADCDPYPPDPCWQGVCVPATTTPPFCSLVPTTNPCDDFVYCNGADTCSDGECSVHAGNPCPGPDGDGNCSEMCDEEANSCTAVDPDGSACTDGLYCTGADTCYKGECQFHAGDPCAGPDGDGNCSESCDEAANSCTGSDVDGSACTDGLFCSGTDSCSGGSCTAHTGDPCAGPDGDGNCSESCDEAANSCTGADQNGSACTDGVSCTAPDACAGGICVGAAQDALCGDGLFCNGQEFCDTSLDCQPGTPPETDDGFSCTADSCDEAADLVSNVPDDTRCDNNLYCDGEEFCDPEQGDPDSGCADAPDPEQPGKVCREDPLIHAPTAVESGWPEGIEVAGAGRNRLAYLAAGTEGLRIYNVSELANPSLVGSYLPSESDCRRGEVDFDEVVVDGTTAYVAAGLCGLLIVDVGDPSVPLLLGGFDTLQWVQDVKIRAGGGATIAYLADHWGGLRIVDVSDPAAPVELGSLDERGGLVGPALSLQVRAVEGEVLVYVATMGGFFIVDATLASAPTVEGSYDTTSGRLVTDPRLEDIPQHVLVVQNRAYLPIWMGGLLVLDVSNPSNPTVIQEVETVPGQAFFKVEVAGWNLYVTEGQCGLRVFDTHEGGDLAEVFFESVANPIKIGGGTEECTAPSNDPWAWDIDDAAGLAFVSYGVLGPPYQGDFQSIDFRQPGSGLLGECGLGAELVLMLPLLVWYRRTRGVSRNR